MGYRVEAVHPAGAGPRPRRPSRRAGQMFTAAGVIAEHGQALRPRRRTRAASLLRPDPANEVRLRDWASAAKACDLPNIHGFTRGLDLDIDAAIAVTLLFHNGRTEGANTKTKMIKKQMCGRAGFAR